MKFINTIEAETAQKKYYAAMDAAVTNQVNKTHFTAKQILMLERAQLALSMLHFDSDTKLNYRKTIASIKVFNRNVQNKKQYQEYIAHLTNLGFERKASKQGIIYAIKKSLLAV